MKKMKNKWQSRALACALAVTLVSGTAVMTPIADFVGTNTIASAATYTGDVEVDQLQKGDILKKGLSLVCYSNLFVVYDENNNEIVGITDGWLVDKDYTINSITFAEEGLYTIYVTSATSAPKLAQGLIINSGDTVDFTGQWFGIDDEEWSWGQGVYTITYSYYDPDSGQYCFLLGDVPIIGDLQIYVTSPNIGTNVALKVNGGNGTEDTPFTFEVVQASYTVTWKDGTETLDETDVPTGQSPVYDGETPTNDSGTFIGWKDENNTFYATGTELPNITADTTYTAVFEKTLAVGTEYYIGDILNTNGSKYVIPDNRYSSTYSYDNRAVVPTPTYRQAENCWYFADMIRSGWGFTMADNAFSGTETVIGFRCVSGDGSSSNTAFKFDLIYENETDTCEMDFSDVAESLVSIKDADENTVALNNGKATIKTGYVITSAKPLSFPKTYAVQQTDENNFVYVIKNMIQSEKKVAYDTSAFKGTVTAYEGRYGVTVEGYEGTSVQKFSRTPYYNKSVTVDFSHGTMLTGRNEYYDAPLDKFFDIYNADGENITDLFEFSNMKGSNYNYYYYKLKQNLETDIYVFPTGTQFTITLPEGVEIENKDVILSQEDNVYTVKPVSDVTLLSDSLINIYRNSTLVTLDMGYSAVKNHQFVYEVKVTNQFNAEISTASVIRTQEEFKNVKTGDYIMPTEILNISDEGYGWYDVGEYIGQYGYYSPGSSLGSSIGSSTITIGTDSKFNVGSSQLTPVNPYLCTVYGQYDIDTYKGNAWRVDFVGSKSGYDKVISLKGTYYTGPAEYEFTWADNHNTATVTFNGGEPVEAVVELVPDYENKKFLCTAVAEYNDVSYIETAEVSFPDLAEVASVVIDYMVIDDEEMPTVTVTDTATGRVLEPDVDYTISYSGDKTKPGTITVTVTAKEGSQYIGSVTKKVVVLSRALTASISERQNVGKNVKVTITGSWCVPADAVMKDCGIARLHVNKGDEKYATKECVYELGIKKSPAVKSKNAKMSYSLSMNQTAAKKTICAVAYAVYEIDGTEFVSISDVFTA